jgi:23S rRNA maturation-related 3'-5' exoribonuclease YhaM
MIYDKINKTSKVVDISTIPEKIESFIYEEKITKEGLRSIISSDVNRLAEKTPEVTNVIQDISSIYKSVNTSTIELVEYIPQSLSNEYRITTRNGNDREEFTVSYNRETKKSTVTDVKKTST